MTDDVERLQFSVCAALDRLMTAAFLARFRLTPVTVRAQPPLEPAPILDDRAPDHPPAPIDETLRVRSYWGDELDHH